MMRFSLAVAIVLAGISVYGLAQQKNTFRVKPSRPEAKASKSNVPIGKTTAGSAGASTSASKELQNVERQSVKSSGASAGKKSPRTAAGIKPALKPAKDKPNPPINFNGNGGSKSAGMTNQGANPYKGRLRQKHSHQ
jgi:hypothetical protein